MKEYNIEHLPAAFDTGKDVYYIIESDSNNHYDWKIIHTYRSLQAAEKKLQELQPDD